MPLSLKIQLITNGYCFVIDIVACQYIVYHIASHPIMFTKLADEYVEFWEDFYIHEHVSTYLGIFPVKLQKLKFNPTRFTIWELEKDIEGKMCFYLFFKYFPFQPKVSSHFFQHKETKHFYFPPKISEKVKISGILLSALCVVYAFWKIKI